MAALTKEQILNAQDMPREIVNVPEWGGDVWVRTITGLERDKYEQSFVEHKGRETKVNLANARARLCALAICDEGGAPLFNQLEIAALSRKSAKALDRVYAVAQRLSGLSDKDVEELTGNSDADQNDASTCN